MITVTKKDEVYLRITTEPGIEHELSEYFCFFPSNYQYSPAYTGKRWDPKSHRYIYVPRYWDGKIRLFAMARKELYVGLLPYLKSFADERNYALDLGDLEQATEFSEYEAVDFVKSLNLPHTLQPEQLKALILAVRNKRHLFLSPTASGKSLISYLITRYFDIPTLIIVPTTALVGQLFTDFQDYSMNNGWNVGKFTQKICEGAPKDVTARVVISTWQGIYKQPIDYFKDFRLIIGDECHHFQAKSLETLMRKTVNSPIKIGLTGSIQETQVHRLVLEGLFGPVKQLVKTKELIDRGFLADFEIKIIALTYPDHIRKTVNRLSYQQEVEYIAANSIRTKFIKNLALSLKGNTLLLFHLVDKHGKIIYDAISTVAGDRKVFFIHGKIEADQRNAVRNIVEKETDAIIVASYGVFSTGVNIKNLNNLILASAFKSKIRNLQSIGRGLRRSETKLKCVLYDLADDFSYSGKYNYSLKHLKKRIELYTQEGFPYKFYKVGLDAPKTTPIL